MVNQSQRIIVQSMLPLYAVRYLHLSPSQIGMLFAISGMVIFIVMIPAGFLMDRVGRKWCTVPSTAIPAVIFLLIPMTTSFVQLALLIGIAGVAQGLSLGSLATSTYDVVPAMCAGGCKRCGAPLQRSAAARRRCLPATWPYVQSRRAVFGLCAATFTIGPVARPRQ